MLILGRINHRKTYISHLIQRKNKEWFFICLIDFMGMDPKERQKFKENSLSGCLGGSGA